MNMERMALTFGDAGENHIGNQMLGEQKAARDRLERQVVDSTLQFKKARVNLKTEDFKNKFQLTKRPNKFQKNRHIDKCLQCQAKHPAAI